jgi:translation initiation factor IF-3
VRLIGSDGSQLGVQPLPAALQMAREADFDLVEVAPNADPPVCKIMDYERYKYEQQQKRKESKRKATQVVIKEMKFRPKIDQHDYSTKMRHVERFLGEGNKVKLTIMFRGREMAHPELGLRIRAQRPHPKSAPSRPRPRHPSPEQPDAQDEDPPRCGEAVPDHRYRQDPPS